MFNFFKSSNDPNEIKEYLQRNKVKARQKQMNEIIKNINKRIKQKIDADETEYVFETYLPNTLAFLTSSIDKWNHYKKYETEMTQYYEAADYKIKFDDNNKSFTISWDKINKKPKSSFKPQHLLTLNVKDNKSLISEECSICLEEYKEDEYVVQTKCLHYFHNTCYNKLRKRNDQTECPLCKTLN